MGSVSNNSFAIPYNDYFWIGEPQVGIDDIEEENIHAIIHDGTLHICGTPEDCKITVYNIDGRLIYNGTETQIDLEQGLYIINIAVQEEIPIIIKVSSK